MMMTGVFKLAFCGLLLFPPAVQPAVQSFQPPSFAYLYDWGDLGPNWTHSDDDDGVRHWQITWTREVSRANAKRWSVIRIEAMGYPVKRAKVTRRKDGGWLTDVISAPAH